MELAGRSRRRRKILLELNSSDSFGAFSFEAEETRRTKKEKEGGRRREKRRRRRINKSSTDVLRERRRGGGRRGEGVSSSGQQILLPQDFTNVTLVLEDCKGSQAPCSAPSR